MIDASLKRIWAEAAFQYVTDEPRRYRNHKPDLSTITDFIDTLIDRNFSRDITKQNIYNDDVEEKIERALDRILTDEQGENGSKMTRRRAMAESIKATYSSGLKLN